MSSKLTQPGFVRSWVSAGVQQLGWSISMTASMTALLLGSGMAFMGGQSAQAQVNNPNTIPTTTPPSDARFSCEIENGRYTVMYRPISQPGQSYAWATPTQLGGGWTEDRRCNEISRRLEFYRPDGLLELRTSVENGMDILCVTTEAVPGCRIVLTVPPGQDPIATRDRIFGNLVTADSGQQTQGVVTYRGNGGQDILGQIGDAVGVDLSGLLGGRRRSTQSPTQTSNQRPPQSAIGSDVIYLRPFLDPADGGTGERL
jgi:hypothetical protein